MSPVKTTFWPLMDIYRISGFFFCLVLSSRSLS